MTRILWSLSLALFLWTPQAIAAGFPFQTGTFEEALEEAKKSQKPLLVKVYTTWCGPCKRMDREIFATEAMHELAPKIVALKVDGDSEYGKTFNQKFRVSKYPTTLFFNHKGEESYRLIGARSLAGFMKLMGPFLDGTLRPDGSPAPLSSLEIAYRTSFQNAVNTPDTAKKSLITLAKVVASGKNKDKAMLGYIEGEWIERRHKDDPKTAIQTLREVQSKFPRTLGAEYALLPLARAMAKTGKRKAALLLLTRALKKAPKEKKGEASLRITQFLMEEKGSASRSLLNGIEKDLKSGAGGRLSATLWEHLAHLYLRAGKKPDAIRAINEALSLFPHHPWYALKAEEIKTGAL